MEPYIFSKLDYPYDALEPMCDARSMEIHHLRHHLTYTNRLNDAMKEWYKQCKDRMDLGIFIKRIDSYEMTEDLRSRISFNGGGYLNHCFFWLSLAPFLSDKNTLSVRMAELLTTSFGSVEAFKEQFKLAALKHQGSGWCWLLGTRCADDESKCKLEIVTTVNHEFPLSCREQRTLLTLDLWEHAYYLKFQDRRDVYIDAFWNVVNWQRMEANYDGWLSGKYYCLPFRLNKDA
jgi:Fe-Mn family superoxide dismutase